MLDVYLIWVGPVVELIVVELIEVPQAATPRANIPIAAMWPHLSSRDLANGIGFEMDGFIRMKRLLQGMVRSDPYESEGPLKS